MLQNLISLSQWLISQPLPVGVPWRELHGLSLESPQCSHDSVTLRAQTGCTTPEVSQQDWAEGKDHLPQPNRQQLIFATGLYCWLFVKLFSTQIPGPFLQSYFPARCPQSVRVSEIIILEMQDFIIPFVELHDFPASPFLQVVGILNVGLDYQQLLKKQYSFLRVYEGWESKC